MKTREDTIFLAVSFGYSVPCLAMRTSNQLRQQGLQHKRNLLGHLWLFLLLHVSAFLEKCQLLNGHGRAG